MWLNHELTSNVAIARYRTALLNSRPNHIVIDNLFDDCKLEAVTSVLRQPQRWQTQQHTYAALYVDGTQWQETCDEERFVQRDVWQRDVCTAKPSTPQIASNTSAQDFLRFLRDEQFLGFLSRIFGATLTDINVAHPAINTNYFRLSATDFVRQHADDSPGRQVCMLLYLNKGWKPCAGGDLVFRGNGEHPLRIAPLYNRCVLFDPSSTGSEHWVEPLNADHTEEYRYNVTSWYWTE